MNSVSSSVPSAVSPSASTSVAILTDPQLGPYQPSTGSSDVPSVPRSGDESAENIPEQPHYGAIGTEGSEQVSGGYGAPSVPRMGIFFKHRPIDEHYLSMSEPVSPYEKVNNPPTRGMWTRIQSFLNHIAYSQHTTETGFKVNGDQQRTSVMRNALPSLGAGYAPETASPYYRPQSNATYKYNPSYGTDLPGNGVLNSSQLGAGQTAGGIGGNLYSPSPGSPDTNSTADMSQAATSMPVWG